jgi:hypothetical protein
MCRLSMADAARFPEGSAEYFEVIFTTPRDLLSSYLKSTFKLSHMASVEAADDLIGRTLYPRFTRALFGIEPLYPSFDDDTLRPDFDLKQIRKAVSDLLKSLA